MAIGDVLERTVNTTHTALSGGRRRALITIHDQWVREAGQWAAVNEALTADGQEGFSRKTQAMRHLLRMADDGTRRWYPRKDRLDQWVEFGRPQYWTGATFQNLPLGAPTYEPGRILWDRPAFAVELSHNWHRSKVLVTLKDSGAARRIRWPVTLRNLRWDNWQLWDGAMPVATVSRPTCWDSLYVGLGDRHTLPISASYADGYVEFTADLAGAVYPVYIDPTLTVQPDGTAGKDTWLRQSEPNVNMGGQWSIEHRVVAGYNHRGLIEFDVSSIPSGSPCNSMTLSLYLAHVPDANGTISWYSIAVGNADWIEGTKEWATAEAGEPCWTYRQYDTVGWAGSAGLMTVDTDYESAALGSFSYTTSDLENAEKSTLLTAARVAGWFGDPNTNYGMLSVSNSGTNQKLRSSEFNVAASRPKLVVDYDLARSPVPGFCDMSNMGYY